MENRYITNTLPGPKEKNPIDHVRPNSTVRLTTALKSCNELRPLVGCLLALICLIWIRTTMNTKVLHNRIRRIKATTVT